MRVWLAIMAAGAALAACASKPEISPGQPMALSGAELASAPPYDARRNAMADVDAALAAARADNRRVLLVMGGNWCHDSRAFADSLAAPGIAALVADKYELVYVDVGHRDRNLDVAMRFGVAALQGTPTVLILSPDGELLNADSVSDWTAAASRSDDEVYVYLEEFAG